MIEPTTEIASGAVREIEPELRGLFTNVVERDPHEAVKMLEAYPDEFVVKMLELLNPAAALKILQRFGSSRRETILATASPETTRQWMRNQTYPERTVGRLMQPPLAVFQPTTTVGEATEQIRRLARKTIITYGFVTDEKEKLLGVVVMRDMLLAQTAQRLEDIMLKNPFYLTPDMSLTDAMRAVLVRHFPVYPVCEKSGHLIALLRGQMLFEAQAVQLSAQPGEMVGVESEERLTTLVTKPQISASVASGKFVLRIARRVGGRIFSGHDRSDYCAGSVPAGAHRPGSKHWGPGAGSMLARYDPGRFEIGPRTNAPEEGDVAWNIKRSSDRYNRRNRDVHLCNDAEKPAGFNIELGSVPRHYDQLLFQWRRRRDGALGFEETRGRSGNRFQHSRHHFHRCWLPACLPWARGAADVGRFDGSCRKRRACVRAVLCIATI
jgi:CBS domain-containing protein